MPPDLIARISEAVDSKGHELIEFTRQLVSCLSENPPGDERAITAVITGKMAQWNLPKPEIWSTDPSHPNILCTCTGSGGGRILLYNGHTDTKPIGKGTWTHDPCRPSIVDGRLYGRGSADTPAHRVADGPGGTCVAVNGIPARGPVRRVRAGAIRFSRRGPASWSHRFRDSRGLDAGRPG